MVLWIAHNRDPAAIGPDDVSFWNVVYRVIGAFAVHVGADCLEQRPYGGLVENDHVVHPAQGSHQLGAVGRGQNRSSLPLEPPNRGIVVDRYDKEIGFLGGSLQIADVADVQEVETAVGESDGTARGAIARAAPYERIAIQHLTHGVPQRDRG